MLDKNKIMKIELEKNIYAKFGNQRKKEEASLHL